MIEFVIITHGHFAEELYLSAEMILGKQGGVHAVAVEPGIKLADIADKLDDIINKNEEKGIIIFTDMFGGSPSNIAFSYAGKSGVEIVSGVNLPMILKAFSGRMSGESLSQLVENCSEAGKASIKVGSELIRAK